MKKLMAVLMCLAVAAFVGKAAFAEDENDIMKRHEERMKKVVLNTRAQSLRSESKIADPVTVVKDGYIDTVDFDFKSGKIHQEENAAVIAAKNQFCETYGIDEKKIKDFGYTITWGAQTASIPPSTITGYRIGLVYKGKTYIYEVTVHETENAYTNIAVKFTGEILDTKYDKKGNLILYTELKDDAAKKDLNGTYGFLIKDLAEFLDTKDKKIDAVGVRSLTNQEWADKYNNGEWGEVMFGSYSYSEVSLEYKGQIYTYGLMAYDWGNGGASSATLDPSLTGGNVRRVEGPYMGIGSIFTPVNEKNPGVDERMDVKAAVELRFQDRRFTGEMANNKETLELQHK